MMLINTTVIREKYAPWEEGADEPEKLETTVTDEQFTFRELTTILNGEHNDFDVNRTGWNTSSYLNHDANTYITAHETNQGTPEYYEKGINETTSIHLASASRANTLQVKYWLKLIKEVR